MASFLVGTTTALVVGFKTIGFPTRCLGPSMLPTINARGDCLWVNRLFRFDSLAVGDVIVCESPKNPNRHLVKRIAGLPGDTILRDPTSKKKEWVTVG